jgi:hypothetical protein
MITNTPLTILNSVNNGFRYIEKNLLKSKMVNYGLKVKLEGE